MPNDLVARQFLDSLVAQAPSGAIKPWLATSWTVSPNGLTYTFLLRKDVKFTDGTPFNASAVKANLDRIVSPSVVSGTDGQYLAGFYRSTTVAGPYTAVVHLSRPYSAFLQILAQSFMGIESPTAFERGTSLNCQSPVGTGPFVIQSWTHGQDITFVRNPNYNSPPSTATHTGPAYLSKIVWKFIPDDSARFAAVQSGQADAIDTLPPEDQSAATSGGNVSVLVGEIPGSPEGLMLNTSHSPFNNLDVRKAFLYAADVNVALKSAYFGVYTRAGGPLSSVTPNYDPAFQNAYPYNLQTANQLLSDAGWVLGSDGYRTKAGKTLTVNIPYSSQPGDTPPEDVTLYQEIQASEKQAGFEVNLQPLSQADFYAEFAPANKATVDLVPYHWVTNSADALRPVYSSSSAVNKAYEVDPTLDSLFNEALAANNANVRNSIYARIQGIISDNAWELTLYPESTRLAIYKTVHGVELDPALATPSFYDAWVTTG